MRQQSKKADRLESWVIQLAQAVTASGWPMPIDVVKLDHGGSASGSRTGMGNSKVAGLQQACLLHLAVVTNARVVRG